MKMSEKEQKQWILDLYVLNGMPERKYHDIIKKNAVAKDIIKKYFPNWNYNNTSKPKLEPRRNRE
jgi:hypothetical protein